MNKLGFFPENLLGQFKTAKLFISNLADSCLITEIFYKIINDQNFTTILHIHFDKYKAQLAMYEEGIVKERILGLNYEPEKGLIDNINNVNDYISRIIGICGMIDVSVSFSDFDDK